MKKKKLAHNPDCIGCKSLQKKKGEHRDRLEKRKKREKHKEGSIQELWKEKWKPELLNVRARTAHGRLAKPVKKLCSFSKMEELLMDDGGLYYHNNCCSLSKWYVQHAKDRLVVNLNMLVHSSIQDRVNDWAQSHKLISMNWKWWFRTNNSHIPGSNTTNMFPTEQLCYTYFSTLSISINLRTGRIIIHVGRGRLL